MSSMARAAVRIAIVLALLCAVPDVAIAYEPQLTRYPYLTDVVGSTATVNWATDRTRTSGRIRYGEAGAESCTAHVQAATRSSITINGLARYAWRAQLTGLTPGVAYCYRVELGSAAPVIDLLGADPSPEFHAQLPAGSSDPFSFAVLGDWGAAGDQQAGPDNRQAGVMSQIAASGVRFAVGTGDTAYPSGTQTNYGDLIQTGPNVSGVFAPAAWAGVGSSTPLFNAVGNHGFNATHLSIWPQDGAAAGSDGRYGMETYCCANGTRSASYPSAWYAFDAGNARFYVLEAAWSGSNVGSADEYENDYDAHWAPGSPEYEWLQQDLRNHPSPLKFAFFHYPLYSSNADEGSDPFLQGEGSLEGLLARYGVDIGFSGHAHNYTRNSRPHAGSLVTYVTGGGGARLQPASRCGAPVAYAVGWSYSSGGSRCGAAPRPASTAEVFHFLKVSVAGTRVTVTPIDSQGRSFDVQAYDFSDGRPSPPSGLRAVAAGPTRVDLSWTAATDDVGVTGYEIWRDGVQLATATGAATVYSDTTVAAGTSHRYEVRALDAAGNVSDFSASASVTTPVGGPGVALVRQATGGTSGLTAAPSFTVPVSSAGGDAVVASIAVQAGTTNSVSAVTDSAGNAWSRGPVGFLPGSNTRAEIWYSSGAVPVASVTVRLAAADIASANVSVWSGVSGAASLDAAAGQGNASSPTASTPAILTSGANDLIVGTVNYPRAATSTLAEAGFAALDDFTVSSVRGRAAYRVGSAAGRYSAEWSLSAASPSGGAILALEAAP